MATATKKTAPKAPAKPRTRKAPAAKATTAAKTAPARSTAKAAARPAPKRRVGLISAITLGIVAAGSAIAYAARRFLTPGNAEHEAPDLALDAPRSDEFHRAPDAFRPDPTAAVPASEREGLRPATASSTSSLVTH